MAISGLGIDDIEAARLADRPRSTLHQPLHDIGAKAAEVLIRQIETGARVAQTTLFPATLVERRSVAPAIKMNPTEVLSMTDEGGYQAAWFRFLMGTITGGGNAASATNERSL